MVGAEIVFSRSGVTLAWDPSCESLLELAQLNDLNPDYSCRLGICNTCLVRLVEGEVEHRSDLLIPPEPNEVLLCSARPLSTRIVVDA